MISPVSHTNRSLASFFDTNGWQPESLKIVSDNARLPTEGLLDRALEAINLDGNIFPELSTSCVTGQSSHKSVETEENVEKEATPASNSSSRSNHPKIDHSLPTQRLKLLESRWQADHTEMNDFLSSSFRVRKTAKTLHGEQNAKDIPFLQDDEEKRRSFLGTTNDRLSVTDTIQCAFGR